MVFTGDDVRQRANMTSHAEADEAVLLTARVDEATHVVLETLMPAERVTFVLHDVFAFPFDDIGAAHGAITTLMHSGERAATAA